MSAPPWHFLETGITLAVAQSVGSRCFPTSKHFRFQVTSSSPRFPRRTRIAFFVPVVAQSQVGQDPRRMKVSITAPEAQEVGELNIALHRATPPTISADRCHAASFHLEP